MGLFKKAPGAPWRKDPSTIDSAPQPPRSMSIDEIEYKLPRQTIASLLEELSKEGGQDKFNIIGQSRALGALDMALSMKGKGYNVFVTGAAGTGRRTAVRQAIEKQSLDPTLLRDIAYGCNFITPEQPRVLYFSKGKARSFRNELLTTINNLQDAGMQFVQSPTFKDAKDSIQLEIESEETQMLFDFEGKLKAAGFSLVEYKDEDQSSTDIAPIIEDQIAPFDELQKRVAKGEFDEDTMRDLRSRYLQYLDELSNIFERTEERKGQLQRQLSELLKETMMPQIKSSLGQLAANYPDPTIERFTTSLGDDLMNLLEQLLLSPAMEEDEEEESAVADMLARRYDINILVDHSQTEQRPVVTDNAPSYPKLFGSIELPPDQVNDPSQYHLALRSGALHRASGGFLILRAEDILKDEEQFNTLKRVLSDSSLEIRSQPGPFSAHGSAIKPEAASIWVKTVLIGREDLYELLYMMDEEFSRLFKVPAEFDNSVPLGESSLREFIGFFSFIIRDEDLLPLSPEGCEALLHWAVRMTDQRARLTTRFSHLADLLRESSFWARKEGADLLKGEHVSQAMAKRTQLYNLVEEKIDEQILNGELMLRIEGSAVGRVNGLAVIDQGFYSFGRPSLLTAQVSPGSDGIITVDREAGLSGEIHDKGTYIVISYINATYASDFAPSMNGSLSFEQNYSEVDGDSASSTEIYALLSAIARVPLRQDIAVTGSVNQMGEIQPVGGVIEKIEGFFKTCEILGLNGNQGVMIPAANVQNLVLSAKVCEAIREGKFNIWAIRTIDEGLAVLTGKKPGERDSDGNYPENSLNLRIEQSLRELSKISKDGPSS